MEMLEFLVSLQPTALMSTINRIDAPSGVGTSYVIVVRETLIK